MPPDAAALAAFADFVRALIPRLLLYPGGLFVLGGALVLTLVLPRLRPVEAAPVSCRAGDEGELRVALALAWLGWALLPLPGAPALPGAPDLLVPLGLLLTAALLAQGAEGDAAGWRREAAGRPLLLGAPLVALAALGAEGLLPPAAPTAATPLAEAGRVLAGLSFVAGFCVCYGPPGAAPWAGGLSRMARATRWMGWWGWLGAGAALGPATWSMAAAPVWAGPLLVAALAAAAAGALSTPVARSIATRGAPWGWAALGLAILVLLLGR